MNTIVKKSLNAPVRQITSCVSWVKDSTSWKGNSVRRKSAPCCYPPKPHESSWIRTYQSELHRERKLRQVILSQKREERQSMRTHCRNTHHYTKKSQDRKKTKAPPKHEDSLFGAFQGLSLNSLNIGANHCSLPSGEKCKVM